MLSDLGSRYILDGLILIGRQERVSCHVYSVEITRAMLQRELQSELDVYKW
jgi:hypothetical protein